MISAMGKGGARENAGRKPKYDYEGQEKPGRPVKIPGDIPDSAIERFIRSWFRSEKRNGTGESCLENEEN